LLTEREQSGGVGEECGGLRGPVAGRPGGSSTLLAACLESLSPLFQREMSIYPGIGPGSTPDVLFPNQTSCSLRVQVPDMNKRNIVNLLLVGAAGLPVAGLALPYATFFIPPR